MNPIDSIVNAHLCIGCGFCAAVCPNKAILMKWSKDSIHVPIVNSSLCNNCGICNSVCPNEPNYLVDRSAMANRIGAAYGVPEDATAYFMHDADPAGRKKSASGGALTVILSEMLKEGHIDGVVGAKPVSGSVGQPHLKCHIHTSINSLKGSRSSHYHPLNYSDVLREVSEHKSKKYAMLGTPCIKRAFDKMPRKFRESIAYFFCLVCSHNTTGRFIDTLAIREGLSPSQPFTCNLRHKNSQMEDADSFFNLFSQGVNNYCRNRFLTDFTFLWRNYFLSMEACLYCPDFYGAEADLSVKDPWEIRSDPQGWSLVLVRNPRLKIMVERCATDRAAVIEPCPRNHFLLSQTATAAFKSKGAIRRSMLHPDLKKAAQSHNIYPDCTGRLSSVSREGRRHLYIARASNRHYDKKGGWFPARHIQRLGTLFFEPERIIPTGIRKYIKKLSGRISRC